LTVFLVQRGKRVGWLRLVLLAWLAFPFFGHAQETLQVVATRALARSPEVQAAQANLRALQKMQDQAQGAWFPVVDLTVGQGQESSNNSTTRFTTPSNVDLPRKEVELTASQPLFDGGSASGQIRRFEAKAESAAYQLRIAAETHTARVAQAFMDVVRLRTQVRDVQESLKDYAEILRLVTLLADAGKGRRADIAQVQARMALTESNLSQTVGQLAQAQAVFQQLGGQSAGELESPQSFASKLPVSLTEALDKATTLPAPLASDKELVANQADRDSARSRLLSPKFALEAGATRNQDIGGTRGLSENNFLMLRMRYNLFRGGTDSAKVEEAQSRVDEAMANYQKTLDATQSEIRQAWSAMEEARTKSKALARYVSASAEVAAAYKAQFEISQRSLLDLLSVQSELSNAQSSLHGAQSEVSAAEFKLLASLGLLLDSLGIRVPSTTTNP
jgi:adhesin transport system outer membrane protein